MYGVRDTMADRDTSYRYFTAFAYPYIENEYPTISVMCPFSTNKNEEELTHEYFLSQIESRVDTIKEWDCDVIRFSIREMSGELIFSDVFEKEDFIKRVEGSDE